MLADPASAELRSLIPKMTCVLCGWLDCGLWDDAKHRCFGAGSRTSRVWETDRQQQPGETRDELACAFVVKKMLNYSTLRTRTEEGRDQVRAGIAASAAAASACGESGRSV